MTVKVKLTQKEGIQTLKMALVQSNDHLRQNRVYFLHLNIEYLKMEELEWLCDWFRLKARYLEHVRYVHVRHAGITSVCDNQNNPQSQNCSYL